MILLLIYLVFSLLLSRLILKANIFNIASLALISYWAFYPLENLKIGKDMYQTINGIKEIGIYMYLAFGLSFLVGVFIIIRKNIKKIKLYPRINSKNNLFFISISLACLGLICFSYTYGFDIKTYFQYAFTMTRSQRMEILSTSKNALPYSIFFIPSITTLLIGIKKYGFVRSYSNFIIILIIFLLNVPIFISYFIEGDRSSIIKLITTALFTLGLSNFSIESLDKNSFLIENFRLNKNILFNRIKYLLILFIFFSFLLLIGIGRGNNWKNGPIIFNKLLAIRETKELPSAEFRANNFTIDFALARKYLNIEETKTMFTWDKLIFYPLPTYVYKRIFNEKKPLNIGDAIGLETKEYVYGKEYKRKIGFGLSPIAEGLINFGIIGVIFTGFIYGIAIGLLQSFYNKISLNNIDLLDIIILNTLGIVPLMMRAGSAGIYNWIFSSSFVILLPLLIIEVFNRKNYQEIFILKKNDTKK